MHKSRTYFGFVEVDSDHLSQLYQRTLDLVGKMKWSAGRSPEQNTRDCLVYRKQFDELIGQFGDIYKPKIEREEDRDKDINVLKVINEILPELTIENVQILGKLLGKSTETS